MEWRQGATGETVFVKFEPSLSRIRAACGRALRERRKPRKFAIAYENLYYGNLLSATLAREAELSALVRELKPRMTSEAEGVWQCAAMLQADTNDGILLHGDLREEHDAYLGGHRVSISADSLDNLLVISYAPGGSYTALVLSR